jgi:quercetin dioxygenase-like cupin family protein
MVDPQTKPGEVVDICPSESELAAPQRQILVQTEQLEVARRVVPAGTEIKEHTAKGEIIVQCLQGRVTYIVSGKPQTLKAGTLLYLPTGEPHSVKGIENALLLLTIFTSKR